jgi:kynureninase
MISTEADYARLLDEQDELRSFRERFLIADPKTIYLDGNSLSRLPKETTARARQVVEREWGERLIRSWNESWIPLTERLGDKLARLLGARPDEVVIADSTSVNLFKLVVAALTTCPQRKRVVTDDLNFPSDVYVLQSAVKLCGGDRLLEIVRSPDGISLPEELLAGAIDDRTALVSLSHTAFKSGFAHRLCAVTELAHGAGALMLWDLSHSVGAMPIELNRANVDLAVGCTYKHLHGGPGAPAFLFVRRELQEQLQNPIAGWFGSADPFGFDLTYRPGAGLTRMRTGTPPMLSIAAIEPGVELVLQAGLDRIRAKSVRQTEYLVELWESALQPLGFRLNSPREATRRGAHVSFGHDEGLRIDRALIELKRVIPDFRVPDNIRLGVCPLYTTFAELHAAVMALRDAVVERLYERYPVQRVGVT